MMSDRRLKCVIACAHTKPALQNTVCSDHTAIRTVCSCRCYVAQVCHASPNCHQVMQGSWSTDQSSERHEPQAAAVRNAVQTCQPSQHEREFDGEMCISIRRLNIKDFAQLAAKVVAVEKATSMSCQNAAHVQTRSSPQDLAL